MASLYDLYIEQGTDYSKSINANTDYTGYTIAISMEDSTGVSATVSVAWDDDSTGEYTITMTDANTTAMAKGSGKYNIDITSGGTTTRLLKGRVYVDEEV